eukprot:3137803-Prymnesium_polylepis.1
MAEEQRPVRGPPCVALQSNECTGSMNECTGPPPLVPGGPDAATNRTPHVRAAFARSSSGRGPPGTRA